MKEYELYVPLHYNDGRPVELDKLIGVKRRLVSEFGGLTHFPQENEGLWKVGSFTFRDRVVILRVLAPDVVRAERFFTSLKEYLRQEWDQQDVLIVCREVTVL
jgi:hypothetical protein